MIALAQFGIGLLLAAGLATPFIYISARIDGTW